jgi:hypothetical protein
MIFVGAVIWFKSFKYMVYTTMTEYVTATKSPTRRPTRLFTTRPYFLHAAGDEGGQVFIEDKTGRLVTIRKAVPGSMAVLSEGRRGRQFYVCNSCGAGFVEAKVTHRTPWNSECKGR